MLGLVLWSDDAAGRALIWCEDQGDLAWHEVKGKAAEPLSAGDLVHVTLDRAGGTRVARALWIVARGAGAGLPQRLSQVAARQVAACC